jgi:hypothetical protein
MRRSIIGIAMFLVLAGCATTARFPIRDTTVRIDSYGFSILPPQETGWYRLEDLHFRGTDVVVMGKQSGSKTHTVVVFIRRQKEFDPALVGFSEYATNQEVFASYVENNLQKSNPPGSRMRLLEHSTSPDTRLGYCVKGISKFEDHGSPYAPQILIQDDWTYTCLHPDSTHVSVEISFSERGFPGESDPALTNIREQFFKSFQFRPL